MNYLLYATIGALPFILTACDEQPDAQPWFPVVITNLDVTVTALTCNIQPNGGNDYTNHAVLSNPSFAPQNSINIPGPVGVGTKHYTMVGDFDGFPFPDIDFEIRTNMRTIMDFNGGSFNPPTYAPA